MHNFSSAAWRRTICHFIDQYSIFHMYGAYIILSFICITKCFIQYLLYTKFQITINLVGRYCIIVLPLKVRGNI
jgi:hypothetical protein